MAVGGGGVTVAVGLLGSVRAISMVSGGSRGMVRGGLGSGSVVVGVIGRGVSSSVRRLLGDRAGVEVTRVAGVVVVLLGGGSVAGSVGAAGRVCGVLALVLGGPAGKSMAEAIVVVAGTGGFVG